MSPEIEFVSWPQVEAALNAVNPPLRWSKESLVRLARRNPDRLKHFRDGNRQSEVFFDARLLREYVRANTIQNPDRSKQFNAALQAEIDRVNAPEAPRKRKSDNSK